jgi:hypothetical protein
MGLFLFYRRTYIYRRAVPTHKINVRDTPPATTYENSTRKPFSTQTQGPIPPSTILCTVFDTFILHPSSFINSLQEKLKMISSTPSKRSLLVASASLVLLLGSKVSAVCHICRTAERTLGNPNHKFTMRDSSTDATADWTCGYLEESVAELNPNIAQENFICALAQNWAERECECNGPPIAPFSDDVWEPNPACNLCENIDSSNSVPSFRKDELVNTGIAGRMPCGGLYENLAKGILPNSLCAIIQESAAEFCCNLPIFDQPPVASPAASPVDPPRQVCGDLHKSCSIATPCCANFVCKTRFIGAHPICSAEQRSSRQRLAGIGLGGAGSRARYSN